MEIESNSEISELQTLVDSQFMHNKQLKMEFKDIIGRLENKLKEVALAKRSLEKILSKTILVVEEYQGMANEIRNIGTMGAELQKNPDNTQN